MTQKKKGYINKRLHKELIVILKVNGQFLLDWQKTASESDKKQMILQEEVYHYFLSDTHESLLFLGFLEKADWMSESLLFLHRIASAFVANLTKQPNIEEVREKAKVTILQDDLVKIIEKCPYLNGVQYLNIKWMHKIISELNRVYSYKISQFKGSVDDYFTSLNPKLHLVGRVYFYLTESEDTQYPFTFHATYSSLIEGSKKPKQSMLENALVEYQDNAPKLKELLIPVQETAAYSEFINQLMVTKQLYEKVPLTASNAYLFLNELPLYEETGILCVVPKWWKQKENISKLSITIGDKSDRKLDLQSLLSFNMHLTLAGETSTKEELERLANESEGLALIKDKWVEVNHKQLKETIYAYEQAEKLIGQSDLSMFEALRLQLNIKKVLHIPSTYQEIEVTNGQWLKDELSKLSDPSEMETINCGDDFHTVLREYQKHGLNWLYYMKSLKLGTCLADDMGLGKTVQIIALLNYIRGIKDEKALLVIPASIIGNWISELKKFAPSIKYYVIHPSENKNIISENVEIIHDHELFITTYKMVSKIEWIKNTMWDTVILDEAQAIKNPRTKQTRTIKQLTAEHKIALTGTPIENHLSDLWSLFDFLNKGLLGTIKEFNDFTKVLKESNTGYLKLKNVVSPFILRRLKTDKDIIADLPEKVEMKSFTELSKKQTILYRDLVTDLKAKLDQTDEGIQRKGLVLSSIMKFKQICNHPSQFLKQTNYIEKDSGKFTRLREICEIIYEKRERVLIFTQFKTMTAPLNDFLEEVFGHKGLVFHGGTSVVKRKDIIAKFQGDEYVPFMVISIKAGGVGLNLTAANHVIHFDRWWNPAVENQATDRVFRIGQKKNVIVHKFITSGTIEEKIDAMIEDKIKLSSEIISDQASSWINEMNNDQLMDLFSLKK